MKNKFTKTVKTLSVLVKSAFACIALILFILCNLWLLFSIVIKIGGPSIEDALAMFFGVFIFTPAIMIVYLFIVVLSILSVLYLIINKIVLKIELKTVLNNFWLCIKTLFNNLYKKPFLLAFIIFQIILLIRFLIWCI